MPLPLVRLVTPASASTDSVDAFGKELTKLKWLWAPPPPPQTLDFKVCSVEDTLPPNNTLAIQAQSAVTDVQNALQQTPNLKVVIVTAGIDATSAVLQILPANSTIPVVQAAGGWLPSPLPGNVTGFVLNPLDPFRPFGTSAKQLKKLVEKGGNNPLNIGVLYDANNGLSTLALNALQALAPKLSPAPGIVPINTNGDVHNFTVASLQNPAGQPCTGFMLLPNAQFYEARRYIAHTVVEGAGSPVQFSIYPEREYKKEHNNKHNKFVHGHHIPLTFRRAALYVDSLLDGTVTIANLAPQEATSDEDL
jgi:hypothetical protein